MKQVDAICKAEGKQRADILRVALHEWLRDRRLRSIGRDSSTTGVREFYRDVVRAEIARVIELLADDKRIRQRHGALLDDTHELMREDHEMTRQAWRDCMRLVELLWGQLIVERIEHEHPILAPDELERLRIDEDHLWEIRVTGLLDTLRERIRRAAL